MFSNTDSPRFRDATLAFATVLVNSERHGDQRLKPTDVFLNNGEGLPQQALIYAQNQLMTLPTEGMLGKFEQRGWFAVGVFARWASETTARLTNQ